MEYRCILRIAKVRQLVNILVVAFLLGIVFDLFLLVKAYAEEIPTNLVIVRHKYATVAQQHSVAKAAMRRIKTSGANQRIVKVTTVKDICNANKWDQYTGKAFYCWERQAYRKKWCEGGQRCHVLKPPVFDKDGISYSGGVASGVCTFSDSTDFSYAIVRAFNDEKKPRIGMSINIVAHENGHNNGSEHDYDNKPWIMHPAAGQYQETPLKYSPNSLFLIDSCLCDEGYILTSKYGFKCRPKQRMKLNQSLIKEPLIN